MGSHQLLKGYLLSHAMLVERFNTEARNATYVDVAARGSGGVAETQSVGGRVEDSITMNVLQDSRVFRLRTRFARGVDGAGKGGSSAMLWPAGGGVGSSLPSRSMGWKSSRWGSVGFCCRSEVSIGSFR